MIVKNNPNNSITSLQNHQHDSSRWAMDETIKSRYIVSKHVLGEGCFGQVRKVKDKQTKQSYGCKTIPKHKVDDMTILKQEVTNLESVRHHPHILHFDEVFEDTKDVHVITELLEGGELYDLIYEMKVAKPQRYFPMDDCAHMIRNILNGLAYCHETGIVHRDLKASNFMFKQSPIRSRTAATTTSITGSITERIVEIATGRTKNKEKQKQKSLTPDDIIDSDRIRDIKIIDFGLSQKVGPTGFISGCLGTPYYVAPEVITDEYYTTKCDVWSVGVIAYLVLSLTLPFQGKDERDTVRMVQDCDNHPPTYSSQRWMEEIEPEAIDFCQRLLQKDPECRPTMKEAMNHPWIIKHCGRTSTSPVPSASSLFSSQQQHQCESDIVIMETNVNSADGNEERPPLVLPLSTSTFDSDHSTCCGSCPNITTTTTTNNNNSNSVGIGQMESIPEMTKKKKRTGNTSSRNRIFQKLFFSFRGGHQRSTDTKTV